VRVMLQSDGSLSQIEAISRNVSICGLLLEARLPIPQDNEVSFVMTLQGKTMTHPIKLVGARECSPGGRKFRFRFENRGGVQFSDNANRELSSVTSIESCLSHPD